jgi:hypothetical protein
MVPERDTSRDAPDDDLAAELGTDFEHLRWFELPGECLI